MQAGMLSIPALTLPNMGIIVAYMDMNEAVSKAIASERAIAGMTVKELSEKSGVPERSLMRVLQAEREIKVNQLAQIAAGLDIYPHEIVESAENILDRESRRGTKLRAVENPSEPPTKFDPEALGLAAQRNDLDEDNDQ